MSRKFIVVTVAVIAALGVAAPGAFASGTLTVTKSPGAGAGTITGTIPGRSINGSEVGDPQTVISCGSDCSQDVHDYEKCIEKPGQETICTFHDETVTLTQKPAAGWQFTGWSGLQHRRPSGACKRTMTRTVAPTCRSTDGDRQLRDVGAPTVSFTGPVENAKLHGVVNVGAVAADNAAVSRVRFYVNNVEIADDTNGGDGWGTSFNTSGYPHAQVLTVKAVAFDTSGNASVLGDDDDRDYRVDSQTGLHFEAPTPAAGRVDRRAATRPSASRSPRTTTPRRTP